MRLTEARNRQVVDTSTAETIGRVDGFLIDPGGARITGLRLRDTAGDATLLSWGDLTAFGTDAVTVADVSVLRLPADEEERRRADPDLDPIAKPALAETGTGLGLVTDAEFDAESGALRAIVTDAFELPADRLLGLGDYAAVFAGR